MLARLKGIKQDSRGRTIYDLRFLDDDEALIPDGNFPDGTADFEMAGHMVKFTEMSTPAAPAANRAYLFLRDNGSGKTQLCVRFPTGAVQEVAIEP